MKKNVIALGVSAVLLSMAGAASAQVVPAASAGTMELNSRGLGHQLVFPYFTTQGKNNTLINIVNTDETNGKAVKVRFRGAGNSDDLFDFQVLMSPGDVWTASLAQGADGVTRLTTTDNTCVIPSKAAINVAFTNTNRVDQTKDVAEQTREGYIEVINMANIPPTVASGTGSTTNALFSTIKHNSSGVATCDSTATGVAVLNKLKTGATTTGDIAVTDSLASRGLDFPSSGLAGDWVILNTETQAAWSGSAVALQVNGDANAVFFPQLATRLSVALPTVDAATITTDPLLIGAAPVVTPLLYDFPDMSTPYSVAVGAPVAQRAISTTALSSTYLANEWNSDAAIGGSTDMLFSQPMRRYWAAVNYKATASSATATTGSVAAAVYAVSSNASVASAASSAGTGVYATANTVLSSRLLCLADVSLTQYDREERTTTTNFVVSPGEATQLNICGEAAVTSINAGGNDQPSALEASVARNDVSLAAGFDKDGWLSVDLGTGGLPVVGAAFVKVSNAVQSYGFAFPHKTKE